jgi:hypothetical protein
MNETKPLKEFLQERKESSIAAIAQYIEDHIAENWQSLFENNRDKLMQAYNEAGDRAYGTYLHLLFLSVHKELNEAGLRAEPRLPGDFGISREWGNTEDRQRWMWSTIFSMNEVPLGTIVTIVFHDHTQFRVPRQPEIIALLETHKEDVVEALSFRSIDFKQAREFKIEYEEYVQNQHNKG